MKDEPRKPLNVFAVDGKMNRATGSIPYTSLRWVRRYTKPGEFEMVVPANIYDPSWAYIVCDDRPETGIIQKVEFTDSSQVYGGIDSITVSGFFLESILNNIVFLQESPEQQKVYVPKPRRPVGMKSQSPDVYQDPTGDYWVELSTGELRDTNGTTISGENLEGLTKVEYNDAYADNNWGTGTAYMRYDYWSDDSHESVTRVDSDGTQTTYDVVFTDDRGNAFYRDEGGKLTQATGIVSSAGGTYTMKMKTWQALPDDDPYGRYYLKTVQGPWQRTEMMEPVTVGDSIQIVLKWARRMMGDWIIYAEPDFEGVQKSVDPSFQYLGDLLYSTLYEVGASLRLEYLFESNAYILSVYRGQDRTQSGEETAQAKAAPMMTESSVLTDGLPNVSLPEEYTRVEYIESSGTQWINTGIIGSPSVEYRLDAYVYESNRNGTHHLISSNKSRGSGQYRYVLRVTENDNSYSARYGDSGLTKVPFDGSNVFGRHVFELKNGQYSIDGGTKTSFNVNSGSNGIPFALFGNFENNQFYEGSSIKVFSLSIHDDTTEKDFLPVTKNGEAGLYDQVNGVFYGNAGTGSFTAGPEIEKSTLSYAGNNASATGSTGSQQGYEGDTVEVAENGFSVPNMAFTGWNDQADGGGNAYDPGDAFTFGSGNATLYAQWSAISDSLVYQANASDATGQTPATPGTVGSQVIVAQCGFTRENWQFVGWNTNASGTGATYQPGESYTLTSGDDILYAQWEYVVPVGKAPWAVFSDTWGTLSGYSASRDTSNYKNTCFVLYEYDRPNSFDSNGWPHAGPIYAIDDTFRASLYGIAYTSKRGYNTEHVGDDTEPAIETYLDIRSEKPSCDSAWSREITQLDTSSDAAYEKSKQEAAAKYAYSGDGSPDLKSIYDAYEAAIPGRGEAHLKENYVVETQLDTGTVRTNGYLRDFDLGDLVEMAVSTVGLATQARIIEVEESYTAGNVDIRLTIGDEKLTTIQKARLA